MAIFHLSLQIIGRNKRLKNTVAAAAYRSASRLVMEEIIYNYSKKKGVVFSEIILPERAIIAPWCSDREKLWNRVESSEKRKDAQLAYEVNIALPKELSLEENIILSHSYIKRFFTSKNIIVDLSIHYDNPRNPHIHIMLPLRDLKVINGSRLVTRN